MASSLQTSPVPALPASTVLLIRDRAGHLEVLMMERAKTMAFMPGAFVFPGGKVDAGDSDFMKWQRFVNSENSDDFAFKLAGLRELYEEATVLHTEKASKVSNDGLSFEACIQAAGSPLDLDSMIFFTHWVTPYGEPRRFDTRFYLAPHNGDSAVEDGNEALSVEWVRPQELLDTWKSDRKLLMFPTRLNLLKLANSASVCEALDTVREEVVPMCLPDFDRGQKLPRITKELADFHRYTPETDET